MKNVGENKFFKNAKKRAEKILKNNDRLQHLIKVSGDKAKEINFKNNTFAQRLKVSIRMIKAYAKGDYRAIKWQSILLLVAAVVYFVTPIDVVPDFIPITGLIDDFTVLLWVYNKLQQEIDSYLLWESKNYNIDE